MAAGRGGVRKRRPGLSCWVSTWHLELVVEFFPVKRHSELGDVISVKSPGGMRRAESVATTSEEKG